VIIQRRVRHGVTLMEVLIATFILAIGLVAIMALFPIGAVNMARAINQDRSATHGVNSDAMFRYYWKQAWNNPNGGTVWGTSAQAYAFSQEPVLQYLQSHPTFGNISQNPASSQPSFAVLVDPVGYFTKTGADQVFVAALPIMPVRTTLRRLVNYPATSPGYSTGPADLANWSALPQPYAPISPPGALVRLTTLLDDMTFARPADGSVSSVSGEPADFTGQIDRGERYNAAWLIQRPRNDVPVEANVTVLVYAGRSPTDTPSSETPYPAQTQSGTKQLLLSLGAQAAPNLRRGNWIGFSQIVTTTPLGVPITPYPTLDLYRVTGINTDTPGAAILDLETPVKTNGPAGNYSGTAVVFDNLVEVFDRGTVSATGVTGP
jgi:prepilin-type N-terminal cleavage/methylation domain-containing protein